MHIVHCSNARSYISRGRYAIPMCSFDYQNEVTKNSKYDQTWRPFHKGKKSTNNLYTSEVPSLQKICLRLLQRYIIRTAEVSWYVVESQNPSNLMVMREAIDYLTDHLVRKCPPVYLDEICSTIIDCIEYLIANVYLVQRFTNVLLHANIRKLDLHGRSKELQRAVYCKLDNLTKLELLSIKRSRHEIDYKQFPIEILVLKGVKKMSNLEIFTFHDRCTDSIIIAAAQHCPKLKSVNVFASENVTNACTKYLAKCSNLSEINLSETSVTRDGFANILLGCSELTDVGTFKQIWDSILKVRKKDKQLNLTHIKEGLTCAKHLNAVESCPNLTYLHLDCGGFDGQILKIECLRELEDLTIDKGDFCKNGIGDYLKLRGEKLEKLTLRDCTSIDVDSIGRACPNLKSLEFLNIPARAKGPWRKTYKRRRFKHWNDVLLLLIIFVVVLALTVSFIWLGRT